jgi:hypothetical protein
VFVFSLLFILASHASHEYTLTLLTSQETYCIDFAPGSTPPQEDTHQVQVTLQDSHWTQHAQRVAQQGAMQHLAQQGAHAHQQLKDYNEQRLWH